ncbi:glyoxalase [Geomonas sp. Red276]
MDTSPFSIQLAVSDLSTTEAFYAGILDLPIERPPTPYGAPVHLVLECDGIRVLFVEDVPVGRAHPILAARLAHFPRGIGMTLHLRVEGIEAIYQELQEQDLEVLYPLEKKPYGAWELWCFDPDGYLVVLEEPTD